MIFKTLLFSLGLATLAGCNAQKDSKSNAESSAAAIQSEKQPMENNKNIIYFSEGENKFLKEYEMNVTFKSIAEDSRCPEGTTCVWSGTAVANVEVMGLATRPMTLQISTVADAGRNYHKTTQFNGYTISLAEVTPYPKANENLKSRSGNYRIGLVISKTQEPTPTRK